MIPPTAPPQVGDQLTDTILQRTWPEAVRRLRLAYVVLPAAVATISTLGVVAVGLLGAPAAILFWALPLHVLVIVSPALLALRRLRRDLWPLREWTQASNGIRAQAWILVIEAAAACVLGYPGWPLLAVLALLSFVAQRTSTVIARKAEASVYPADALYRAESGDEIELYADGGYDGSNLLVLVRVFLESDRVTVRSWTRPPSRPTRLNWRAFYLGTEDDSLLFELPFDHIREATLWTFPPGHTQHCWFIAPDGTPLHNNSIRTAIVLSTTTGAPAFTVPSPDADVLAEAVRRRIHRYHRNRR